METNTVIVASNGDKTGTWTKNVVKMSDAASANSGETEDVTEMPHKLLKRSEELWKRLRERFESLVLDPASTNVS